jgi:hypothetical protein
MLVLAACGRAPVHTTPDAAGPTCTWIVTVSSPAVDARGNGCSIDWLTPPDRVKLTIALPGGHSLLVDTNDPIPGDPYGRVEPPIVVDAVYVPCGSGVAGKTTVSFSPDTWSVKANYGDCQQAVMAAVGGMLY